MQKPGHQPYTQPALAYDYRRAILIIQVLAEMNAKSRRSALEVLAAEWLQYPDEIAVMVTDEELLQVLSQHALAHGREQKR